MRSALAFMERFRSGAVLDTSYRVESVLSETDRAHVYVVTHVRFPEVPLVLKIPSPSRVADFDRDTVALASLTSPCFARVCDRGKLPDGRPYRVVERLAGPTLREALATSTFSVDRAMEIIVALAAAVHEAQGLGISPCDLSVDNLMFADGRAGKLCMMRALVADARGPDAVVDQNALSSLRVILERGIGAGNAVASPWKPPSSIPEIRDAMARARGSHHPPPSSPGARIGNWKVTACLSETIAATVYEVIGPAGDLCVLKIAGKKAEDLTGHAQLLARIRNPHVVRVFDIGVHDGTPFVVLERLEMSLAQRLKDSNPLPIDEALRMVDELLAGAEAVAELGGGPCDFSLDHCYQAGREMTSRCVVTHVSTAVTRHFKLYGTRADPKLRDSWSAAVALYELIAGRLPFPTSKHSLAKAWMGVPIPLGSRRRDVPRALSQLVSDILGGDARLTMRELRRSLVRLRGAPPERPSALPAPSPAARISDPPPALSHGKGAVPVPAPSPFSSASKARGGVTPQLGGSDALQRAQIEKWAAEGAAALAAKSAPATSPSPGFPPAAPSSAASVVVSSGPTPLGLGPPSPLAPTGIGAPYVPLGPTNVNPNATPITTASPDPPPQSGSTPNLGSMPNPIVVAQPPSAEAAPPPQPGSGPFGAAFRAHIAKDAPASPPNVVDRRGAEPPPPPDWRLELSPTRCPIAPLTAAAFGADGREIVAISKDAVARYRRGRWTIDPARETASLVRALVPLSDESYLAMTTAGALLKLGSTGTFTPWGPALHLYSFYGALPGPRQDPSRPQLELEPSIYLVGGTTDKKPRGVVAKLVGESLTVLTDDLPVAAVLSGAFLKDGTMLVGCTGGHILRLRGATTVLESTRGCDLDMLAVRPLDDEILVVGIGAWAFRVTLGPLTAQVEPVDTLSALTCLAVDDAKNAWTGSTKGRILRRRGQHWRRMNKEIAGDPAVLAMYADPTRVRAVLADGHLVLGQPIT